MSDGSDNDNIIERERERERESERLSGQSVDDSNESAESIVKDSAKIDTDHIEGYCEKVLGIN